MLPPIKFPHFVAIGSIAVALLLYVSLAAEAADTLRARVGVRPTSTEKLRDGPNYEKFAEGLYARRVFQAVSPGKDYRVEEWGLLIGPGKKTEVVTLPGAATLVVRTGHAVLTIGDKKQELRLGSSLLIPEDQKFSIVNTDKERPVSIQAVIVKGL